MIRTDHINASWNERRNLFVHGWRMDVAREQVRSVRRKSRWIMPSIFVITFLVGIFFYWFFVIGALVWLFSMPIKESILQGAVNRKSEVLAPVHEVETSWVFGSTYGASTAAKLHDMVILAKGSKLVKGIPDSFFHGNYKYASGTDYAIMKFPSAPKAVKQLVSVERFAGLKTDVPVLGLGQDQPEFVDIPVLEELVPEARSGIGRVMLDYASNLLHSPTVRGVIANTQETIDLQDRQAERKSCDMRVIPRLVVQDRSVSDARLIRRVWRHSNKDGSRDLRFNNNPQDYLYNFWQFHAVIFHEEIDFIFSSEAAGEMAESLKLVDWSAMPAIAKLVTE